MKRSLLIAFAALAGLGCPPRRPPVTLCPVPQDPAARGTQLNPTWSRLDANGVPVAPTWKVQGLPAAGPLCLPDPDAKDVCGKFPRAGGVPRGKPACNDLAREEPPAGDLAHGLMCSLGRGPAFFPGHLNFLPASYAGLIFFENHAWPDDDLDFDLLPLHEDRGFRLLRPGLTVQRRLEAGLVQDPALEQQIRAKGLDYVLHVEAKAEETLDHFTASWWARFRDLTREERRREVSARPAVVLGLLGLDAEHGAITEVHPAYALAIQTACGEPAAGPGGTYVDTWAFLLRNSGNEGWCSQWDLQHLFDAPSDTITLNLPIAFSGEMERVDLLPTSEILASVAGVEHSAPELSNGQVLVRFRWPPGTGADTALRAHGTLSLRWWPRPGTRAHCVGLAEVLQHSAADPVAASGKPGAPTEEDKSAEGFLRTLQTSAAPGRGPFRISLAAPVLDDKAVTLASIPAVALPPGTGPCPGNATTCEPHLRPVVVDRPAPAAPSPAKVARQQDESRAFCELAEAHDRARTRGVDRGRLRELLDACRAR